MISGSRFIKITNLSLVPAVAAYAQSEAFRGRSLAPVAWLDALLPGGCAGASFLPDAARVECAAGGYGKFPILFPIRGGGWPSFLAEMLRPVPAA